MRFLLQCSVASRVRGSPKLLRVRVTQKISHTMHSTTSLSVLTTHNGGSIYRATELSVVIIILTTTDQKRVGDYQSPQVIIIYYHSFIRSYNITIINFNLLIVYHGRGWPQEVIRFYY